MSNTEICAPLFSGFGRLVGVSRPPGRIDARGLSNGSHGLYLSSGYSLKCLSMARRSFVFWCCVHILESTSCGKL